MLFGSALDRASAGQDEVQAGTMLCSCDPAHMLPTAAAGGACGERGAGQGGGECVLGGCWLRVEKLNI